MTAMTNKADTPSVRVLLRGVKFGDDTLLARSNRLDGVQFAPQCKRLPQNLHNDRW